ncbi:hypothetical protein [Paenibacillus graminis]|nr:hypothetical protein [Paenibacillus graminis]
MNIINRLMSAAAPWTGLAGWSKPTGYLCRDGRGIRQTRTARVLT